MRAGEERKLVTVLFADLVGSTEYAGDRDPERVRARLEAFYYAMREEIERTGGTVEKFAGDAVMAVFGAPAALEDHAERALHAALAMQQRMKGLFDGDLGLRIGVNTGDVVVGIAHEGGSFVTGDVVNVADRLQKGAEPGEVLAGERTVAAVAQCVRVRAPRERSRRKGSRTASSRLLSYARSAPCARAASEGSAACSSAATNELELLRVTYRRVSAQSEPHLVTLVGEPGVGKSTLVSELWAALAMEEPPPVNRTGRCLAYGTGITYHPLGEILREHYELREGAALEEVEARLAGREILALALGLDVAPDMHPLDARERLHAAAVSFFEELSSACPTVVVIEDIHWAEPDLLDLLERLATDVRGPVMLVATARPEVVELRPTWGLGKRNATVLWLDPLSVAAVSQLLEEKLPSTAGRSARPPRRARRRKPVLPRRARGRARRQRRARPVRKRVGGRPLRLRRSRCRTPCTRCSRRGSTASRRWRSPRFRPAQSSAACSGPLRWCIFSTARSRTSGFSRSGIS